ncbi:hypothetical protein SA2149_04150 [Aggregatibacter actinomycetemcomitans serotype e str. SA2149]|nr:hypothetical protein SA2149_04150 [Aggregatibacter actinomycetemcomitans serotype e str. SA2149]KYK81986.1 hypothetical protein SC383S_01295 [Aggregatibacter actinomycetemcomitans SC383s]
MTDLDKIYSTTLSKKGESAVDFFGVFILKM